MVQKRGTQPTPKLPAASDFCTQNRTFFSTFLLPKPQLQQQLNLSSTLGWVLHDYHFTPYPPTTHPPPGTVLLPKRIFLRVWNKRRTYIRLLSQPQLNLNWVAFDTKMGLHIHHHPTHQNSTSTTRSLRSTWTSRITITTKTASTSTTITTTTTKTKNQNNLKTIGLFLPSFKESS